MYKGRNAVDFRFFDIMVEYVRSVKAVKWYAITISEVKDRMRAAFFQNISQ